MHISNFPISCLNLFPSMLSYLTFDVSSYQPKLLTTYICFYVLNIQSNGRANMSLQISSQQNWRSEAALYGTE